MRAMYDIGSFLKSIKPTSERVLVTNPREVKDKLERAKQEGCPSDSGATQNNRKVGDNL